jgi:hypothetical protein
VTCIKFADKWSVATDAGLTLVSFSDVGIEDLLQFSSPLGNALISFAHRFDFTLCFLFFGSFGI